MQYIGYPELGEGLPAIHSDNPSAVYTIILKMEHSRFLFVS